MGLWEVGVEQARISLDIPPRPASCTLGKISTHSVSVLWACAKAEVCLANITRA